MLTVFARISGPYAGYSLTQLMVGLVILVAAVGILYVVVQKAGVKVPEWLVTIFGILAVAVVAVFALRLLMSL